MRLLEVELTGFKSFAYKTTFRLSDGLTAIIGPNGSGKSNFAEAIRWVLGEQSLKSLRGRTSADVIFAGSSGHKRSSTAAVSLTFSNDDKRLAVDAPEVTFTRRVSRDGEGEYVLNGDPVRLLDVQQLLADAGIGTKSYTVISQGTVDRYLTATPAQRRELFDEATGIKALQLKVQRSERHLHQVTQQLQELQAIIQELEPRLKVLQRQVSRHQERLTVQERLKREQATWFHHEWHRRTQALTEAQARVAQVQTRIAAARTAREAVEQELLHALENKQPLPTALTELTSKVRSAELAYQAATERYQAQLQEREALQQELTTIVQERERAAATLQRVRTQVTTHNLFGELRSLLEQCQRLCEALLTHHAIDEAEITILRDALTKQLKQTATEDVTITAAHDLLQQLEGPLQTVARLTALEDERRLRLRKLALLKQPSTAELTTLRQQLEETQGESPKVSPSNRQAALDRVRTEELQAEREGSAVAAHLAQAETELSTLVSEIRRERSAAFLQEIQTTPAPPITVTEHDLQALTTRLAQLGEIDPLALKEYEETADRYTHLQQQLRDIETTYHKTQQLISTLQREMNVQFRQQFTVIHEAFRRHIKQLFEGGEAELTIVASTSEEAEDVANPVPGIEITVHPPGKKPQHVGLLSGGEKALTSLALLFAILEVQQPPFLVLDEVDAALDEANSFRFAELLREKSQSTQCIVISHNRETMGHADVLYGITMQQDGVSRSYSVKLQEMSHTEAVEEMSL